MNFVNERVFARLLHEHLRLIALVRSDVVFLDSLEHGRETLAGSLADRRLHNTELEEIRERTRARSFLSLLEEAGLYGRLSP